MSLRPSRQQTVRVVTFPVWPVPRGPGYAGFVAAAGVSFGSSLSGSGRGARS